jgi:hypothetical protein
LAFSRSHDAVIRVYDEAGNAIETHEHPASSKSRQRSKPGYSDWADIQTDRFLEKLALEAKKREKVKKPKKAND